MEDEALLAEMYKEIEQERNELDAIDVGLAGPSSVGDEGTVALMQSSDSEEDIDDFTEDIRFLSGTPDVILHWFRTLEQPNFYEVVAQIVSFTPDNSIYPQILAVRYTYGPVLKVACFPLDFVDLPIFEPGLWIRCVGRRFSNEAMRAFSVRMATQSEIDNISRLGCLSMKETENRSLMAPPDL